MSSSILKIYYSKFLKKTLAIKIPFFIWGLEKIIVEGTHD